MQVSVASAEKWRGFVGEYTTVSLCLPESTFDHRRPKSDVPLTKRDRERQACVTHAPEETFSGMANWCIFEKRLFARQKSELWDFGGGRES